MPFFPPEFIMLKISNKLEFIFNSICLIFWLYYILICKKNNLQSFSYIIPYPHTQSQWKSGEILFYTLILENETGQQIDLSRTANRYMFSKIKGLNPPTGTVSTSSYACMNGSYLNNAFIEKRNVVIPFEMRGFDVELRRHELYRVVKPSRYINKRTLYNPSFWKDFELV